MLRRQLGLQAGMMALRAPEISHDLGLHRGYVAYWRQEVRTLAHQTNKWGGRRYTKYPAHLEALLEAYIQYFVVESNWTTSLGELVGALRALQVTRWWLQARFKRWHWTWAQATVRSWAKFTAPNLARYAAYLSWTQITPWVHFKFADEASYSSRELFPRYTIGPRGARRRI